MFQLENISIKRKLMLMMMASGMVAVLFVSGGFVAYERIAYRETMTRDLQTLAEVIGNESTAALSFDEKSRGEEILSALVAEKHIVAAGIYKDGRLFAGYAAQKNSREPFPRAPQWIGAHFEGDHLILFHEIHFQGEVAGVIYLKSDLLGMRERFERYAAIVLCFMLASSVAVYFLSILLQRIISRPVFHLAETARAVSAGKDYSVRAIKHGGDELGQLIDGFNEMLGQIQKRDVALQRAHDELEKRVEERTHDLQQQFGRISLLNQITHAISERQDTASILHVVLRQLEDHLRLDFGSVAFFDAQADTLNVGASRVKNPLLAPKLDWNEGMVAKLNDTGLGLCREGRTIYFSETLKARGTLAEKLAGAGLRSAVTVPLLVENKLFGVLMAARLKTDAFGSGECEFLRMLAEHVALAAHQANLHSELEGAYNELRQTQQTVMQQERLKALGQMASGIAHDINNALSPVVGFADLMLRGEHALSTNGKKYLKHIRTAGEDIAHIVKRLREFYRRRDEEESLQELNLNALAEQVIDMTRPRWRDIPQSRGITVEVEGDFSSNVPRLPGIESELREALTNLVLNAVDALPKGGKIMIRSRVIHGHAAGSSGSHTAFVALEVSDNGIGMNEETRRRCLEPFFSTKGKRGTGLGLAMVYGVVQRHEGKIEIESEANKGTTFRLVLPVRKARTVTTDTEDAAGRPPALRILCIDDEPLLRELLKEMLERDGHEVEASDGGQSGLDAFRTAHADRRPFDVVITDLGMPYVDGRQVARELKSEFPSTPILMLTGWGAFIKDDGSMPAQVDGVLSKPPRSKELRDILCRLASPRRRGPVRRQTGMTA